MTKTIGQVSPQSSSQPVREPTEADLVSRVEALLSTADPADQFGFRGAQFDAGLAWVHFPKGCGGLGISQHRQVIVDEALRLAGVRYRGLLLNPMGIGMGAPTLLAHGTDEQRTRYLRPLFTGEEIWCQLFSEPSSGSDLASLSSSAVRDGDEWVVNGQKVWTTLAHVASVGMLLTRTDPDAPKHQGISYLLVHMGAPGVEVRPLFQMTGEAEFNEVFLTDARVPARNMVGEEGKGWAIAMTTLANERAAIGGSGDRPRHSGVTRLLDLWNRRSGDLTPGQRASFRDRIVELWIRSQVQQMTARRARSLAAVGTPGPEGSISKLAAAELRQAIAEAHVDLEGANGTLHTVGYPMLRTDEIETEPSTTGRFLRSRAATIEGGTSEIMRNILGERILGLPPEPRADRDRPWSRAPR